MTTPDVEKADLAEAWFAQFRVNAEDLSEDALQHLPEWLCDLGRWDELIGDDDQPGVLTDLRFLEAKCAAGLFIEVMDDFNRALRMLPELAQAYASHLRSRAASRAYRQALNAYACDFYEYQIALKCGEVGSAPTRPSPPPELDEPFWLDRPECLSPRVARLRHFALFFSQFKEVLALYPEEILMTALNCPSELMRLLVDNHYNSFPNSLINKF